MSQPSQMNLLSYRDSANDVKNNGDEPQVFSISQLNKQIKLLLEGRFALIWIRGEISNFKPHSSGHFYFSLKDDKSQMSAVMFKGHNRGLRFRPEDGMEVLVRGRVTVYEPRGNYQIFCETMEPVGAGALQMAFEKLKAKLKAEGLFESSRKKALPALPKHVALVTSPTGAAVKDMLNVLGRRFSGLEVTVVPCLVQGEGAAPSIVKALEMVERLHLTQPVDVVICGRGGGSMEDLWAFNEEILARKIAEFPLPIVSAVGHEVDFTIADFVADLRAPTPSAAAELVVKNAGEIKNHLEAQDRRLLMSMRNRFRSASQSLKAASSRLVHPRRHLQDMAIRCDDLMQKLELATRRYFADRRTQLRLAQQKLGTPSERLRRERQSVKALESKAQAVVQRRLLQSQERWRRANAVLDSLSPLRVVERGYSIVTHNGQVVKDAGDLSVGETVSLRFAKGSAEAIVQSLHLSENELKENKN